MTTKTLDEMTIMTVTEIGQTLEQKDIMKLEIEEISILIAQGQPRLVIQSTVEVLPEPSDPEGTETQRIKILVGFQGAWAKPYGEVVEESPQQDRDRMDRGLKWNHCLETHGIPGNIIKVYLGSATPFMVKSGDSSERAVYYECHSLTIVGSINDHQDAATLGQAA